MGDKKRRQRRTKKSKRGKYLRALRLYRSGQVSRATATRNGKSDNGASRAETQLMEESLRPVTQVKTEQMRTPDTHQTIKEEDDQEKNLGNDDNNTTTSQLSCGTAGIDIKEEALDELEESLVSCCNSTAQLLSCDMVGADADKTDEEEMKLEDYCNVNTPSQLSRTISTVEDQQEMDLGNCSNTNTPCQLSCSTPCIEVEKEGGQETNLAVSNCNNTVTSQITVSKEEDVLEEENDFEENEKGLASSEDSDQQLKTKKNTSKWKKKTLWVCKCKEKFTSQASFFQHILEAHPVSCLYCEERFHSAQTCNKHMMTHMSSKDKLDLKGNKLFLCDHCGQFFSFQKMKRHKLTLTEARPYKCEMKNCNSTFKRKNDLETHVCSVHNRSRFPCPFEGCKQTYGVKSKMISHYKVHTGERSHQCSYCGKMFRRTGHLKVHMRIHTGDNPFNCSLCNYSGRQYNSLRWHMKTNHPEHCNKSGAKN